MSTNVAMSDAELDAAFGPGTAAKRSRPEAAERSRACKRPSGPLTRKQRRSAHREEMIARRDRQRARQAGFTPVLNKRVNDGVDGATAVLLLTNAAMVGKGLATRLHPQDARSAAIREVARSLPAPARVFDWQRGAVSKNNDPAYRGLNGDGPKRLAALSA